MKADPTARWLILDTATPVACVALADARGAVHAAIALTETRRHAERLLGAVDAVLAQAGYGLQELAGIAVGRGPGSFIGVRTGIATAKGLALGCGIPLIGLPTLVAMASGPELPEGDGYSVLDAKRGELYVQHVRRAADVAVELEAARTMSPAACSSLLRSGGFVVGSGELDLTAATRVLRAGPTAAGLAAVLADRLAAGVPVDETGGLVPDYARAPDAKLPAQDPSFWARGAIAAAPTPKPE